MSAGYEIMDHPSDVSVRVFGSSLEETFLQAALAMWDLMGIGPFSDSAQSKSVIRLTLKSRDLESLLVNFLNEQIFLLHGDGFVLRRVGNITIGKAEEGYALSAIVEGQKISPLDLSISREIKAATYHEIKVTPSLAEITFDV